MCLRLPLTFKKTYLAIRTQPRIDRFFSSILCSMCLLWGSGQLSCSQQQACSPQASAKAVDIKVEPKPPLNDVIGNGSSASGIPHHLRNSEDRNKIAFKQFAGEIRKLVARRDAALKISPPFKTGIENLSETSTNYTPESPASLPCTPLHSNLETAPQDAYPAPERATSFESPRSKHININHATEEELQQIRHIGKVRAQKIVHFRAQQKRIANLAMLSKLLGLQPTCQTMQAIARQITFEPACIHSRQTQSSIKQLPSKQSVRINLNTATEQMLITLPGIGPTLAKRMIAYREQCGAIKNFDELKEIKGIGSRHCLKWIEKVAFDNGE